MLAAVLLGVMLLVCAALLLEGPAIAAWFTADPLGISIASS